MKQETVEEIRQLLSSALSLTRSNLFYYLNVEIAKVLMNGLRKNPTIVKEKNQDLIDVSYTHSWTKKDMIPTNMYGQVSLATAFQEFSSTRYSIGMFNGWCKDAAIEGVKLINWYPYPYKIDSSESKKDGQEMLDYTIKATSDEIPNMFDCLTQIEGHYKEYLDFKLNEFSVYPYKHDPYINVKFNKVLGCNTDESIASMTATTSFCFVIKRRGMALSDKADSALDAAIQQVYDDDAEFTNKQKELIKTDDGEDLVRIADSPEHSTDGTANPQP